MSGTIEKRTGGGCALEELMVERLLATQTVGGRTRLRLEMAWRQCWWRCAVNGPRLAKRGFDLAGALVLLVLLLPLLLLIALCIKLEDGGPVLFIQTRVGRFGRIFRMCKFRTMCVDAEKKVDELLTLNQHAHGVTFKLKDDPRITRAGRWLRKISFDELPQLLNVVHGDMSLVGPRPPIPREVAMYSPSDRLRLSVMPGITCFWQIGGRAELDFPQQVRLDVQYIEQQSLRTDLNILLKTVPAVMRRKGAY